jgi:hypothetical protein
MYIYNVTVHIENNRREEWLRWMKEEHIPDVLATGKFSSARLFRVCTEDEKETTYAVQYTTTSKETLNAYYEQDAPRLRQEGINRFGAALAAFRTELQLLHIHELPVPKD